MTMTLRDRSSTLVFLAGALAVTVGVILHLPMFWMGRMDGFRLVGMPMDQGMIVGMGLIVLGIAMAAYGLLPRNVGEQIHASRHISVAAPEDAPLSPAHFRLMVVLVVALVIDVMKPASLGFVMPGLSEEYGIPRSEGALVPFAALTGTVIGSVLWGIAADLYGRKATILLSAIMFVGTSICGAMPSLEWNIAMCFLMGAAAGGMLPVTYALLAEAMPSRHRGWSLVLVGGMGAAGGYFAASGFSAWLEPIYSWRILWLLNLPTGLLLLGLGVFIPESAKFLLARGRRAEAQAVMARFGTVSHTHGKEEEDVDFAPVHAAENAPVAGIWSRDMAGTSLALTMLALSWGFINFGILLWLPSDLVESGVPKAVAAGLIAKSALISVPTVLVVAVLYSRWSTKYSLIAMTAITALGLAGIVALKADAALPPLLFVTLLIVGTNGMLAIVLPYAAENYPLSIRGRATGWVAACTKAGGLIAQALGITALVPELGMAAIVVGLPVLAAIVLTWRYCRETKGIDLRDVDRAAGG
ncbi:putative MFS transporter [Novosphingobium kunmingense]|uniref:Putative MFS transporter n=1 Tax=Novosphingobium kunmingense TaxID=1211806 RepID=A0A2N0I229_9SPHN|nr:MFS transporter [Novosphingobium kunmingense]PKB25246.1 putative MFS transporter [Novosphingobium kunmingense]